MTQENATNADHQDRVFGLDVYRAIAIIIVVLWHGKFLLDKTALKGFPYVRMIDGVDLFFVLSGFLIGGILLKEINRKEGFGPWRMLRFWKRRWFRTLPAYYLLLLANFVIVKQNLIHEDIQQFSWKYLVFLQNFSTPSYGFFWESWSLTIEEWFYLMCPILLLVLLRFLSTKRAFIIVTLLMITAPLLYRISISAPTFNDYYFDITFRRLVITRLDSIAYGLLAAWLFYYFKNTWSKYKIHLFAAGIGLLAFSVGYTAGSETAYRQMAYYSIVPISAMLLLPYAESVRRGESTVAKAFTHISVISYSMYLLNLSMISDVIRDNFPPVNEIDGFFKYAAYWAIVIVASTFLYAYFEKPVMDMRDSEFNLGRLRRFWHRGG